MRKKVTFNREAHLTGHKAAIYTLSKGRSTRYLLSGAGDGYIVEWDLQNPELGQVIAQVEGNIFALEYLEEEELLVVGTMLGGIHWVDLKHPEKTVNIAHHPKGVYFVFRIDESIFSGGADGVLTRWSIKERRAIESIHLSHKNLRAIAYSPSRKELAIASSDYNIYFLDAPTLVLKHTIKKAHQNSVFSLCYTPDEKMLLSGGRDAMLRAWKLEENYRMVYNIPAHHFTINAILWHPKKPLFFTASRDKTIRIWDSHNFELLKVLEGIRDQGHLNSVNCLLWQNEKLISASDDRSIVVWEMNLQN